MAHSIDPAFEAIGPPKDGFLIWRIEALKVAPLPQKEYGKFHVGDSYIVLKTTDKGNGSFKFDIHFWIGKESSQDESGVAALKAVELDDHFKGPAVQHRETQGSESDLFLSYFKPCIFLLPGGVASGFKHHDAVLPEPRLFHIQATGTAVRVTEVPVAKASLNHGDVFVLDTAKKVFQFSGAGANIREKGRVAEVAQQLRSQHVGAPPPLAHVEDDGQAGDDEAVEFWNLFGGFGPIAD